MGKRDFYQEEKMKKTIYVFGITLILSIVVFLTVFVMYNRKLKEEANLNLDNLGTIKGIVENEDFEETSFTSDLGLKNAVNETINNTEKNVTKTNSRNEPVSAVVQNVANETVASSGNVVQNTTVVEEKPLEFAAPVAGEIIKDFAIDSLIYSKTLEEWTTHSGIDIKAEKTSIVTAAEAGTIESIKNDPRYGLTITISHRDGFKTIYSNLLSTEFVTEGEGVEKGQTIGTIGETASFEVAEESHLHFEIYKDGNVVNPTIYLK